MPVHLWVCVVKNGKLRRLDDSHIVGKCYVGWSMIEGSKSLDKILLLLTELLTYPNEATALQLAEKCCLPRATAYRHLAALVRHGLIFRDGNGSLLPGTMLLEVFDQADFSRRLGEVGRPVVSALAKAVGMVSHLGIFEQDMVTYLTKSEPEGEAVFTRESHQLEAYCSGIGKVLLAGLSSTELDEYLSEGAFPSLTKNTITDRHALAKEIGEVRKSGHSVDCGEIEDTLFCLAVPVVDPKGRTIAGLSVSARTQELLERDRPARLLDLQKASEEISRLLY